MDEAQSIRNTALNYALMYRFSSNGPEETISDAAKYEKFIRDGVTDQSD